MKICVVSYKFGTPQEIGKHLGLYDYFLQELKTLTKNDHKVFVVCPWLTSRKKGSSRIGQIKIYRTYPALINLWWFWPVNRINRWLYFKSTQRKVRQLVKKEKIDLVYVWQARETGYAIAQIKYKLKCPIVFRQITTWCWNFDKTTKEYFSHAFLQKMMNLPILGGVFTWLFEVLREKKKQINFARSIYRNFDKVLFLSKALKDEAINKLRMGPYKGEVVPLAVDSELFQPVDSRDLRDKLGLRDEPVLFYAGRIAVEKKGLDYLLLAFQKVIVDFPSVKLLLAGGGSSAEVEQLKKLIRELNLEDSVILLGRVPNSDLPQYYSLADFSVVPSVWMEAFGRVIIEAMACAKPVVSTNVGGIGEINLDGQTGLVIEPKDEGALSRAIIKLLKDRELKERLGRQARERVEKYYTYQVIADKLINIFQQAVQLYRCAELKVCYFGSYDPLYTRNRILMKGLVRNNVRLLECNDRSRKLWKFWLLYRQHRKLKKEYDVMFVAFQGQLIMPLAWWLARLGGKPIIFDALFSLYDSAVLDRKEVAQGSLRAKFLFFLDWLACRLADIIIVHTKFHQEFFLDEFKLKHRQSDFHTLYVGVDDEELFPKPELNPRSDPFVVHFHGSYIPAQGLEHVVIGAAKILRNENIIFNLIGRGQAYPEVKRLAQEWQLNKVNFIAPVPYPVLGDYMNKSDVCLGSFGTSPKITRVVPLKVFEALACQRALITAKTPAVEELLTDRENCFLTALGDPQDLAKAILELKNNSSLKERIAQNGYRLFQAQLRPEILGGKLKDIFLQAQKI